VGSTRASGVMTANTGPLYWQYLAVIARVCLGSRLASVGTYFDSPLLLTSNLRDMMWTMDGNLKVCIREVMYDVETKVRYLIFAHGPWSLVGTPVLGVLVVSTFH